MWEGTVPEWYHVITQATMALIAVVTLILAGRKYRIMRQRLAETEAELSVLLKEGDAQRRSFAYGNIKLHNPDITREQIAEIDAKRKRVK
jgi:hypothetical protein